MQYQFLLSLKAQDFNGQTEKRGKNPKHYSKVYPGLNEGLPVILYYKQLPTTILTLFSWLCINVLYQSCNTEMTQNLTAQTQKHCIIFEALNVAFQQLKSDFMYIRDF